MDESIRRIVNPSVYEHLMMVKGSDRYYMETAAMAAEFTPIYPDDPEWKRMALHHLDKVADLVIEGLEVIGIAMGGKCIGLCGYRMVSNRYVIIHGDEVEVPYEMFMAVDDGVELTVDLIYSAQMFIASHEGLKVMQLAN
jgi:hypothetical protein